MALCSPNGGSQTLDCRLKLAQNTHGAKVNVMSAIDMMVESLKRIILDDSDEKLILPIVLPIESMEGITE